VIRLNEDIAERFEEVATLLEEQHANPFRVRAYRRGAVSLRALNRPVGELLAEGGLPALIALPGIGESLARAVQSLVTEGRLPQLVRLRGESDPVALLGTVPGIGPKMAEALHDELHLDTLEQLEEAGFDGRLEAFPGIGPKRLAAVRDHLAQRLQRVHASRGGSHPGDPSVAELLDVDREYREKAAAGELPTLAPHRFNPEGEAWLPVLHATRDERHYTVLFSNTRRAHEFGTTRDWVVLYLDGHPGERPWTVITSTRGPLAGRRIVRGREMECLNFYSAP
jgi:Holliday junction resolvasome RuvABC DNA-binding subunit